jgi:hypothetical protein
MCPAGVRSRRLSTAASSSTTTTTTITTLRVRFAAGAADLGNVARCSLSIRASFAATTPEHDLKH